MAFLFLLQQKVLDAAKFLGGTAGRQKVPIDGIPNSFSQLLDSPSFSRTCSDISPKAVFFHKCCQPSITNAEWPHIFAVSHQDIASLRDRRSPYFFGLLKGANPMLNASEWIKL